MSRRLPSSQVEVSKMSSLAGMKREPGTRREQRTLHRLRRARIRLPYGTSTPTKKYRTTFILDHYYILDYSCFEVLTSKCFLRIRGVDDAQILLRSANTDSC